MPSRLDEEPVGFATVVFLASADVEGDRRSLDALEATLPPGVDVVVVADAVEPAAGPRSSEVVRTSAPLGAGARLNIGIRRARGPVVIVLDRSVVPAGDIVTPLVEQLGDTSVAVVGSSGYVSADMQRFEPVDPDTGGRDVVAVRGPLIAFRRADAAARGPVDEAFRLGRWLDAWWSLVLRDQGEDVPPRRAVSLPGLPFGAGTGEAPNLDRDRDRGAKRNFYRVLDRFRTRLDLAVPATRG